MCSAMLSGIDEGSMYASFMESRSQWVRAQAMQIIPSDPTVNHGKPVPVVRLYAMHHVTDLNLILRCLVYSRDPQMCLFGPASNLSVDSAN